MPACLAAKGAIDCGTADDDIGVACAVGLAVFLAAGLGVLVLTAGAIGAFPCAARALFVTVCAWFEASLALAPIAASIRCFTSGVAAGFDAGEGKAFGLKTAARIPGCASLAAGAAWK